MIQEFYLSVTPVGEEEYLVRTERVAPGVPLAEEQFTWRLQDWIVQTQQLMDDPLLSVLQGSVTSTRQGQDLSLQLQPAQPLPNLTLLGQQLYNALFQATIRDSWMTAQGIAYHRREALRLRLGLKGSRLPCLPWEVLHAGNRPIATGTDLVFSRYQPTFTPIALPLSLQRSQEREPSSDPAVLKILMVISAPTDQESLELRQEVNHLQEELQQAANGATNGATGLPHIHLTILEQPDREHLTQALEQGHYQVLHYAGHSNLATAGGNLYLVNRKTGLSETLSGDDLAGLLVNNGIQMAVFNSCRGAYALTAEPGDETRERSLAEALVKRGIPAVLAMAERIPDDVALTLTRLLYRNLKQGYPVDLSLSRARQGLVSAYGSQQLYWALPILYLHPEFDGYLMPAEAAPSAPGIALPGPGKPTPSLLNGSALAHQPPATPFARVDLPGTAHGNGAMNGASYGSNGVKTELEPPVLDREEPDLDLTSALSLHEAAELADLVDDLEYQESLDPTPDTHGVSDLIRQLSYTNLEEERPTDEAILFAPQSESLIPHTVERQVSPYLELPENPLYRATSVAMVNPEAVKLLAFVSYHWQAKEFTRVRCIPFTEWRTVLVQRLALESIFSSGAAPSPAQPAKPIPHSSVAASTSQPSSSQSQGSAKSVGSGAATARSLSPFLSVVTGAVVTGVILAGGWLAWGLLSGRRLSLPAIAPMTSSPTPASPKGISPETQAKNAALAEQAIADFQREDRAAGQRAVEQLLDQGDLKAAARVLDAVKTEPIDGSTSALRGRLALQGVKANQSKYSLGEAERFLKAATQFADTPRSYANALAFTYYAGGKFNEANALFGASSSAESGKLNRDELTAQAGLALVFLKSVQTNQALSPASKASLRQQAIQLRNRVMAQDAKAFQPEALSQNWIWPQQAVEDWRSLLQLTP